MINATSTMGDGLPPTQPWSFPIEEQDEQYRLDAWAVNI